MRGGQDEFRVERKRESVSSEHEDSSDGVVLVPFCIPSLLVKVVGRLEGSAAAAFTYTCSGRLARREMRQPTTRTGEEDGDQNNAIVFCLSAGASALF